MKLRTIPAKILSQRLTSTGTKLYLNDIKDWDGTALTSALFSDDIYVTLRNSDRTQLEVITVTASTIASAITSTGATISARALGYEGGTTTDTETAYDWDANETYVELGSNPPQLLENMVDKDRTQTITGAKSVNTPTAAAHISTKAYVDLVAGGSATTDQVLIAGTAGETIAAGEIIYFDFTADEWLLADASVVGTAKNVILGVAQGVGTNGVAIDGGVLTSGIDTNQTGMTAGTKQYLSDTAGALSESAGTIEVSLGTSNTASTTDLVFQPYFDELTTTKTISSTNLVTTKADIQDSAMIYAASSAGSDTYAVTLSPVPTAYAAGMTIKMKADVVNTGAATINVNSLGAKAITKDGAVALSTGDILAGQVVELTYDGTQFQLSTPAGVNPVLIESGSITSGATFDITDIPVHFSYIVLSIIGASCDGAPAELQVQVSVDNGSSFDATQTNYVGYAVTGTTVSEYNAASLIESANSSTAGRGDATINIFNYQDGMYPIIQARVTADDVDSLYMNYGTYVGSTNNIDALRIKFSAHSIDAGTYTLHGIH